MTEADILAERGRYWVTTARAVGFTWAGYCIMRNTITHAEVCARIGYPGNSGLRRAITRMGQLVEQEEAAQ